MKYLILFWCFFLLVISSLSAQENRISEISTTKNFRVVIDPGHGGRDSVTRAGGYYEKNIVLEIALVLRDHLQKHDFDVIMTRDKDQFVSLSQRAHIKGDVFVSLHANTVADTIGPSVRSMIKGIEIYTAKEMSLNPELLAKSKLLASSFQSHLASLQGINLRRQKEKSLAVLNDNLSPAILIELGFISNTDDLAFLVDPKKHIKIAEACLKALREYQLNN